MSKKGKPPRTQWLCFHNLKRTEYTHRSRTSTHFKKVVRYLNLYSPVSPRLREHYSPFQNYRRVNSYVRVVRTVSHDSREFCMSVFLVFRCVFQVFLRRRGKSKDAKRAESQMKRCEESLRRNESLNWIFFLFAFFWVPDCNGFQGP